MIFTVRSRLLISVVPISAVIFILIAAACQQSESDSTPVNSPTTSLVVSPEAIAENPTPSRTSTVDSYPPAPPATLTPVPYPVSPQVTSSNPVSTPSATPQINTFNPAYGIYLPSVSSGDEPTPTPLPPTPTPTPTPTIDFAAVRAQLQAQGHDLGFAKIGFHAGVGGNRTGLGDWMRRLDAAGVPFFLKSADDSGPLVEAQEILRNSNVPHTLVYRRSGNEFDTPNYDLPPEEAARQHWQLHMDAFPSELDPSLLWLETINEIDKDKAEWLGRFALETARLAEAAGFRWAAFGWSSGEPELSDWQTPSMLAFLRLAAAKPDRLAIALHEYSFLADNISDIYPFKVGRFQQLYQLTDQLGIPRPTVLITEWGWEYQRVPSPGKAVGDIDWAAEMYAPYPEVKGAAIWYLGGGFGDIATEAQKLIVPVTEYSLGTYFAIPLPPDNAPINPEIYRP